MSYSWVASLVIKPLMRHIIEKLQHTIAVVNFRSEIQIENQLLQVAHTYFKARENSISNTKLDIQVKIIYLIKDLF